MTNMHCERFEEVLAQQADGPLPFEATAHLDACPQCRLLHEDLPGHRSRRARMGRRRARPAGAHLGRHRSPLAGAGADRARPSSPRRAAQGWLSSFLESCPAPRAGRSLRPGQCWLPPASPATVPLPVTDTFDLPATTVQVSRPALDGLGSTLDGNMQRVVASFSPNFDSFRDAIASAEFADR